MEENNKSDSILNDIIKKIKNIEPSFLESNVKEVLPLDKYNYILTDQAQDRLNKLYTYIKCGVPVILEGETGASKTLSAEIICKYYYEMKKKENENKISKANPEKEEEKMFIKFNLSADTKINDLMQKFIGDKNSLLGLKIVDGPFYTAFTKGIPLILDEINLASEEVLQCIEDTLDSGMINIDISGIGKVKEEKKDGFCLIATQNPNKGKYKNKRQNLSQSFLSHFQIIKFPSFDIKELKIIAEKLFKSFDKGRELNEKDKNFISDLIDFHDEWTSKDEVKNSLTCFTIREIAATVRAFIDEGKKNGFKIVKVIYASRYQKEEKNKLLKIIGQKESFKSDYEIYKEKGSEFQIPKEIKGLYKNKILSEVLESAIFSLEKRRNVIIVGEEG